MEINDNLLRAISWTIVHSVWQGLVLALFAGTFILLTRKSSAALRYNLLSALLVLFIAVSALTFSYEFHEENIEVTTTLNLPAVANSLILETPGFHSTVGIFGTAIDFLNTNANAIAWIWFIVFGFKILNICGALGHVYSIRNYKTFAPSDFWLQRLDFLATKISLRKSVILLESALVNVPSAVGFFKNVILIPVGLLANLPQDQIEAILLHELAHIRRSDYFINMLQSLVEVIFFFNPGVLWLSSILKDERENCCDDLAISVIGDRKQYVIALLAWETCKLENASLAMAFRGSQNRLLIRAKRIIYNHNKSLNVAEKAFLGFAMALVLIVAVLCSNERFHSVGQSQATRITRTETEKTTVSETRTEHSLATESTSNGKWKKNVSLFNGVSGADLPDNIDTDRLTNDVISDLIANKIITTTANLSYQLSDKNLIVNNIVQPEEAYQKLKEKYIATSKIHAICYNFEVFGMKN